jgi:hypothetical protein
MKTLLEQIREIDQRIRQTRERAYQLWEEAGKPECDGEEFWHKAKNALNAENAELVQFSMIGLDMGSDNTEITMTTIWTNDDPILDTDAKTATEEQIEKAKERLNDKRDVENFLMDFKHGHS